MTNVEHVEAEIRSLDEDQLIRFVAMALSPDQLVEAVEGLLAERDHQAGIEVLWEQHCILGGE